MKRVRFHRRAACLWLAVGRGRYWGNKTMLTGTVVDGCFETTCSLSAVAGGESSEVSLLERAKVFTQSDRRPGVGIQ